MKTSLLAVLFAGLPFAASCASTSSGEERHFAVHNDYEITVPEGAHELRAWFALPDDGEALQEIRSLENDISSAPEADVETRIVRDSLGNRFLYLSADRAGGKTIRLSTRFDLARREALQTPDAGKTRPLTEAELSRFAPWLEESSNVRTTPAIRAEARRVVGDEDNPVRQARLLYDWVLGRTQYWVKFPGQMKSSGVGSSEYCYEQCTGNCTDFHSLYAAAARAVSLPTRMVYGSFFKAPLDGVDTDQSYHCWIEFFAPNLGWVPLDVAVADIFVDDFELDDANRSLVDLTVAAGYRGPDAELVDYYFGNLDARRVTWNRGRDLALDPEPRAGRLNALPKAHVEVDGQPLAEKAGWTRKLTFVEKGK